MIASSEIYCERLYPAAINGAITLYCTPDGQALTFHMHPQIPLLNKQIYNEALPLLYCIIYRIDLTSPHTRGRAITLLMWPICSFNSTYII